MASRSIHPDPARPAQLARVAALGLSRRMLLGSVLVVPSEATTRLTDTELPAARAGATVAADQGAAVKSLPNPTPILECAPGGGQI